MPSDISELQGEKMGACCRVAEVMVKKRKKYLVSNGIADEMENKEKSVKDCRK